MTIRVELCPLDDPLNPFVLSDFVMVAKDPFTNKGTQINQLVVKTDEEMKKWNVSSSQ
jgi:hypothetical protein